MEAGGREAPTIIVLTMDSGGLPVGGAGIGRHNEGLREPR
jgi:hypothetical protein